MIYLEYFGLDEPPFSIAPNPRYLYLTHQHQEALAHLSYGLGRGGIVLLTGEVGTGKTTISRKLLEDIPEHIEVAWIVNPKLSAQELLASICDELSIQYDSDASSIKIFTDLINSYLIEAHGQGRNVVLMIDEAQNLSPDVLEQLRLLTNLETNECKLLQIILLGQPELKEMLERTDLRQLAQRITSRFHLQSLSQEDSGEYVRHRLAIAGCNRPVFSNKAIDLVFSMSHGTPRLINLLCDRALLGVYGCNESMVEKQHVQQASLEVMGDMAEEPKSRLLIPLMIALALIFANALLLDRIWPWLPTQTVTVAADAGGAISDQILSNATTFEQSVADQAHSTPIALAQAAPVASESIETAQTTHVETQQSESVKKQTAELAPSSLSEARLQMAAVEQGEAIAATPALEMPTIAVSEQNTPVQTALENKAAALDKRAMVLQPVLPGSVNKQGTIASAAPVTDRIVNSVWQVIETRGSKLRAFQTLANIWHHQIVDEQTQPCDQLVEKKIVCLQQRANSWLLREYNRPAVFQVLGADGEIHFAVIRSVQQGRVIIQLEQQHWEIALAELEQYWQGNITLFWEKPEAYQHDIQHGDGGALIPWLADQMDRVQGKMIPPQTFTTMNDVLVERVKDFQLAGGLPSDGIVGPLTLMRINESINPAIPLLNRGTLF